MPETASVRRYISPIGYDTRRVTRPVVNTGLGTDDTVLLVRPDEESDSERATQAIADVRQLLQEIEPGANCVVERVSTDTFEGTVRDCCSIIANNSGESELIVSLAGGARDVLLPLTVASLVFTREIDRALFFSDLDSKVREWTLPNLTARIPERTSETFETIVMADGWLSLSAIAEETDQSKSTVIRHVNDLERVGIVEADTSGRAKRVRVNFSGELLSIAR